jgi:hypothetical protein
MIFLSYLGGWAFYRLWKWLGWVYGAKKKGVPGAVTAYWVRFWPLVASDAIIQIVIGFAWMSGLLDKIISAAFSTMGWTPPAAVDPMVACLVGFVVASMLSEVIVKHLPVGDFAEPLKGNGEKP